jgi:cytochrome P450
VRTFFSNDIAQKQVNGKNLSLALADFSSFNFYRSRSGLNLLMIMLFGEKARMINFTEGDRQLEKTIQEIRRVVFEIIEERINGKGKDQQDFMNLYINEMNRREELYQKAQKAGEDTTKIHRISKEDILQQLLSFYFAGIDTTGHLIAFALYCCAEYQ